MDIPWNEEGIAEHVFKDGACMEATKPEKEGGKYMVALFSDTDDTKAKVLWTQEFETEGAAALYWYTNIKMDANGKLLIP